MWSDRGGDATYHGPGQLVGYPIVSLDRAGIDLLEYLRRLEASLVDYLATIGVQAEPGATGLVGIWSGGAKIAAIGVRVNQGVTSHGFGLNLTTNLEIFNQGIVPCGLEGKLATSVAAVGGPQVTVPDAARQYLPHFARALGVSVTWGATEELTLLAPTRVEAPPSNFRIEAPTQREIPTRSV